MTSPLSTRLHGISQARSVPAFQDFVKVILAGGWPKHFHQSSCHPAFRFRCFQLTESPTCSIRSTFGNFISVTVRTILVSASTKLLPPDFRRLLCLFAGNDSSYQSPARLCPHFPPILARNLVSLLSGYFTSMVSTLCPTSFASASAAPAPVAGVGLL